MKKICIFIIYTCLFCSLIFIYTFLYSDIYAGNDEEIDDYDLYEGYDFDNIDDILSEKSNGKLDFKALIEKLYSNDNGIFYNGYELIKDTICEQLMENKTSIIRIVFIALSMALLSNVLVTFSAENYSETSYFVLHLILVNSLMISFISLLDVGKGLIGSVLRFMECLVPSFFLAVGISNGYTTSTKLCTLTLTVMTIIEKVIIDIFFPAICIYVAISLVTSVSKENKITKIGEMIASFVEWGTRSLLTIVLGLNVIESMILPMADRVKNKGITNVVSMIPVVGNGLSGVTNLMLSSGEIIKSTIGGGALVAMIIVVAVPVVKLLLFIAIYKVIAAIIEPISDKRVINGIEIVTRAAGLLYKVSISSVIMLGASVAIICLFTRG